MTRARTLKTAVRARMTKTGERYTTARRHVLAERPATPVTADARHPSRAAGKAAPGPTGSPSAVPRGAVSDAKVRERTGHDLAYWFEVLDHFGTAGYGHTAAARHLREQHDVDGWYSQGITVAYERARGLRAVNQRVDGKFGASVSITVPFAARDVAAWITSPRRRARWTADLGPELARMLTAAVKGPAPRGSASTATASRGTASRGLFLHHSGEYRCRHRWADGLFQVILTPKTHARTTVLVEHSLAATRAGVEQHRAHWRAALKALSEVLSSPRVTRR